MHDDRSMTSAVAIRAPRARVMAPPRLDRLRHRRLAQLSVISRMPPGLSMSACSPPAGAAGIARHRQICSILN